MKNGFSKKFFAYAGISILVALLTPFIWKTEVFTSKTEYIYTFFQLFSFFGNNATSATASLGVDTIFGIIGLFSVENLLQFLVKSLFVFVVLVGVRRIFHNRIAQWTVYAITLVILFLVPRYVWLHHTWSGNEERVRNAIREIYTVGRHFDDIKRDMDSLLAEEGNMINAHSRLRNTIQNAFVMEAGTIREVSGKMFKFSRCYKHFPEACFDEYGTLVYVGSYASEKEGSSYRLLERRFKYCNDLFAENTCLLNPQKYVPNIGNVQFTKITFLKRDGNLAILIFPTTTPLEYDTIQIFTLDGTHICDIRYDENRFNRRINFNRASTDMEILLDTCNLGTLWRYMILIVRKDGRVVPVMTSSY